MPADPLRAGADAAPAAGPASPDRTAPDLVLRIHAAFAAALGAVSIVLLATPSPTSDPFPVAILGVLAIGALIAILLAIAVAGATGRHSPLAAIDVMVTAPVLGLAPSSLVAGNPSSAPLLLIVVALLLAGLASVVAATRVVRERALERWLLGAVVVLVAAFWLVVPFAVLVPLLALITLFGPRPDVLAAGGGPGRRPPPPSSTRLDRPQAPDPSVTGSGRPGPGRGRGPDAAAVLAGRRSEHAAAPTAAPPSGPVPGSATASAGVPPTEAASGPPSPPASGRMPATGPDGPGSTSAPDDRSDPGR